MIAIGPVFPEEKNFALHRPVRDQVAALEKGLAGALRDRGYAVLGHHSCALQPDQSQLSDVLRLVEARLQATPTR